IPSRDTVVNSLQTGEIDMWMVGAAAYWNRLRAIKSITAVKQPSYAFSHLDFNLDRPIFKDVRVRKALSIAIDRQTLINKISNGVGRVQDGIISPASPFYDPSIPRTPWDISRANALLDQAGWKMGQDGVRVKDGQRLAVTFVSNSGSPDTDARLELIRGWWRQIGVQLDRKEYPPSLMFAQVSEGGIINTGKFDAILFAWYLSPTGDLSSIYGCAEFTPSGQNSLHWCNKKADEAMTGEKLTYDFAKQKKLDDIVQQAIVADVPTYVLNIAEDIFAYNSDLKGFHPNAVSAYDDFMNVDI
ncbi:MAG: hypothetical protein GIW95_08475, partial [Candidatus Eremiobacteraeota bacterium]|nr:hypothetical protein [Candidatus Eremiobacteraeota bacterium]